MIDLSTWKPEEVILLFISGACFARSILKDIIMGAIKLWMDRQNPPTK